MNALQKAFLTPYTFPTGSELWNNLDKVQDPQVTNDPETLKKKRNELFCMIYSWCFLHWLIGLLIGKKYVVLSVINFVLTYV